VDGDCFSGPPLDCDDSNECTADSCDEGTGCLHENLETDCDDQDACTGIGRCAGGECRSGPAIDCDDGNPCTDDSCDSLTGCSNTHNEADCDDLDACTTADRCGAGVCRGGPALECDDGNPCTDDACEAARGCVNDANQAPCEDGDACTVSDTCSGAVCQPGPGVVCDDGNPCTTDSCDSAAGCVTVDNEDTCDDGLACTLGDTCAGGLCSGVPLVPADIAATLRLSKASGVAVLGWSAAANADTYSVLRGRASDLPVGPGSGDVTEVCFANGLLTTSVQDASVHPPSGTVFWYAVRGQNACAQGTWGRHGIRGTPGAERVSAACP
jgi:hypothetical protein